MLRLPKRHYVLTIKKTKKSKNSINNNEDLSKIASTHHGEERHVLPHLDSTQQQILKQSFVRNRGTNEVKVVLAIGWSRDEDFKTIFTSFKKY